LSRAVWRAGIEVEADNASRAPWYATSAHNVVTQLCKRHDMTDA
jgi:hypothetical protein